MGKIKLVDKEPVNQFLTLTVHNLISSLIKNFMKNSGFIVSKEELQLIASDHKSLHSWLRQKSKENPSINISEILSLPLDDQGNTLLHLAITSGNIDMLKELVLAGADLLHKDSKGNTYLEFALAIKPEISKEMKELLEEAPKIQAEYAVEKMLKARAAKPEESFEEKGQKQTGVSAGYIARDKEELKLNMIKTGRKKPDQGYIRNNIGQLTKQDISNQLDLITEYISAPLYKLALKQQAPDIGLVTRGEELKIGDVSKKALSEDTKQDSIAIRSTFFDNFQTLSEFTNARPSLILQSPKLKEVKGFEKIIAACLAFGEIDWHAGNIGVITSQDANGNAVYTAAKIDHGRSLRESDVESVNDLAHHMLFEMYADAGVKIDVTKLVEAIEEMQKISMDEIKNRFLKQLYDLVNAGMPLEEINKKYALPFDSKPEKIVDIACKTIESNLAKLTKLAQEIEKDPISAANTLNNSHTKVATVNKYPNLENKNNNNVRAFEFKPKVDDVKVNDLYDKWGKAGHVARVKGELFKSNQESEAMSKLMTFCLKLDESPNKKVQAEALIRGIQENKLTKKGVITALESIGATAELMKAFDLAPKKSSKKPSIER